MRHSQTHTYTRIITITAMYCIGVVHSDPGQIRCGSKGRSDHVPRRVGASDLRHWVQGQWVWQVDPHPLHRGVAHARKPKEEGERELPGEPREPRERAVRSRSGPKTCESLPPLSRASVRGVPSLRTRDRRPIPNKGPWIHDEGALERGPAKQPGRGMRPPLPRPPSSKMAGRLLHRGAWWSPLAAGSAEEDPRRRSRGWGAPPAAAASRGPRLLCGRVPRSGLRSPLPCPLVPTPMNYEIWAWESSHRVSRCSDRAAAAALLLLLLLGRPSTVAVQERRVKPVPSPGRGRGTLGQFHPTPQSTVLRPLRNGPATPGRVWPERPGLPDPDGRTGATSRLTVRTHHRPVRLRKRQLGLLDLQGLRGKSSFLFLLPRDTITLIPSCFSTSSHIIFLRLFSSLHLAIRKS